MKTVYIAHPISGNVKKNVKEIYKIMEQLIHDGEVIPFAPYLPTLKILDDENPVERAIGIELNKIYFVRHLFDELWIYGDHVSNGVKAEIDLALKLGIQVRPISNAAFSYMKRRLEDKKNIDFILEISRHELQLLFNALEYLISHRVSRSHYHDDYKELQRNISEKLK